MLLPLRCVKMKMVWGLLFMLLWFGCKTEHPKVVAKLGSKEISLLQFRLAYMEFLKQPTVFDSKEMREQFLNELINRQLLADLARQWGLDKNEALQGRVEAFFEKNLREAHYKALIEPKIEIDSTEAKAVYSYTRQQRKLKHLFFQTRAEAQRVYQLLSKGKDWDSLAQQRFKNSLLAQTGGELGWVHWDQMEYEMAMTAFGQPLHSFSKPVKSTYGYHILWVEDLKIDPLITEEEFLVHQNKVFKLLKAKKGQALARDYIQTKMQKVKIQVNPRVLKAVGQVLQEVLRRKPTFQDQMRTFQLNEVENQTLEQRLWQLRHEVLAYVNGQPLTVKKFLYALNFVPYRYVCRSMKTALDFVLRDQVLTQEARQLNLAQKYPFVHLKTINYENYLLQLHLRRTLSRKVQVKESELHNYYNQHRLRFKQLPFDSVKTYLQKQLLIEKRKARIAFVLDSLRNEQKIALFPQTIHDYYQKLLQ